MSNKISMTPLIEEKHDAHGKRLSGSMSRKQTFGKQDEPKNKKSEDLAICAVVNKVGDDVTPKHLTERPPPGKKTGLPMVIGDASSEGQMLSSDYLMSIDSLSSSIFGGTAFRKSPDSHSHGGTSATLLDEPFDQIVEEDSDSAALRRSAYKEEDQGILQLTKDDLEKFIEKYMMETDTMWLMDIPSEIVSSESEEAPEVNRRNDVYKQLLKTRVGNERYLEKGMTTLNAPLKSKGIQTSRPAFSTVSLCASWSDIYDRSGPYWRKDERKSDEEVLQIIEQQVAKASENDIDQSAPRAEDAADANVRHTSLAGAVPLASSEDKSSVTYPLDQKDSAASSIDIGIVSKVATHEIDILKSEAFQNGLLKLERVINLNTYHRTLTAFRGLPWISDDSELDDIDIPERSPTAGLFLNVEHLWTYQCSVTTGRNVSCICWNTVNPDLLAVGHCQVEYTKQKGGLVCCWSVKNLEYPRRIYRMEVGVTSLAFSIQQPCLLAVGLHNGLIAIYNVAILSNEPILDTLYSPARHIGPVWGLQFLQRLRDTDGDDGEHFDTEMLLSVSWDGFVKQWAVRQGFTCKEMLKLHHVPEKPTSEKKFKPGPIVASKYDGGLCFDFSSFDPDIYLVGTEEGYIHRCSCLHTEQPIDTYVGHNGPVYKVQWSCFDENVFISSSADWTVNIWHIDHLKPTLAIAQSMRAVPDVCWSPHNSTVLAYVHEGGLEVWDLNQSLLDPMLTYPSPEVKLSAVSFTFNSNCVLVGDELGQVSVYQLPEIFSSQADQILALHNAIKAAQLQSHCNDN